MENLRFRKFTHIVMAICVALFALSYFIGNGAFVCLIVAAIGMAEAVVAGFMFRFSFDIKLLSLILLLLILGRLFYLLGWECSSWFFGAVLLLGIITMFRFTAYMNKYCQKDVENKLDS